MGKAMNKRTLDAEVAENVGEEEREEDADAALQAATATNQNGETRKRRLNRAK